MAANGGVAVFSDGETPCQADLDDPETAPIAMGPGAVPALSPDGSVLAVAVPMGRDSTIASVEIPGGLGTCIQETVSITAARWNVVLHDLSSGSSAVLAAGIEPEFHPRRLAARRMDLF